MHSQRRHQRATTAPRRGPRAGSSRPARLLTCWLLLSACNASEQDTPGTGADRDAAGAADGGDQSAAGDAGPGASAAVIGEAGGTVLGPNGAKVVIPPGALASDTLIAIERTSLGAPPLPAGAVVLGPMFAFTPHGTQFAVPVTLSIPFDPGLLPAGATAALFKTNAEQQWIQPVDVVLDANRVVAQVTSFSWLVGGVVLMQPMRNWSLTLTSENGVTQGKGGVDDYGGDLRKRSHFGGNVFDLDLALGGDGSTSLELFSNEYGDNFWVSADAPNDPLGLNTGTSTLLQRQTFAKDAKEGESATLQYTITEASLEAVDFNGSVLPTECPARFGDPNSLATILAPCNPIAVVVHFSLQAYEFNGGPLLDSSGVPVLKVSSIARLHGHHGDWQFEVDQAPSTDYPSTPAWLEGAFEFTKDSAGSTGQSHPLVKLKRPIALEVNLSSVDDGWFTIVARLSATAYNRRGKESAAIARLRDPLKVGGVAVSFTGLRPINGPVTPQPEVAMTAPCTTGANSAAGVLQLSAATFAMAEQPLGGLGGTG